jgi:hypothetical protein
MIKRFLVPVLLLACAVGTAQAGPVSGTQAFVDAGSPTFSPGTDINTATTFTIGDWVSTTSQTGIFTPTSLPKLTDFGSVTFSVGAPTSFSITQPIFGTFTSTSITEAMVSPGIVGFYILGNYTPGTVVSGGTEQLASFTISFNQSPNGGAISDSGTFSVPPAQNPFVPEPSTLIMGLTSVVGGIFFHLRRRRRLRNATA